MRKLAKILIGWLFFSPTFIFAIHKPHCDPRPASCHRFFTPEGRISRAAWNAAKTTAARHNFFDESYMYRIQQDGLVITSNAYEFDLARKYTIALYAPLEISMIVEIADLHWIAHRLELESPIHKNKRISLSIALKPSDVPIETQIQLLKEMSRLWQAKFPGLIVLGFALPNRERGVLEDRE